ncbi:MAG TPA: TolC family protein [Quisquiliibacterium sp.]|nr:TolC family protein [Quisquiliibacterium sp.]
MIWPGAEGSRTYSLEELIRGARERSPLSSTTRSGEDIAAAGIVTARALPNPELSLEPGRINARTAGVEEGSSTLWTVGVPIENPWMRSARLRTAESAVDVARARTRSVQTDLSAAIRARFFEIARLEEAVIAFREDLQLTEQILERIRLRVRTGEAPRFDLLRAESETAVARKNLESTQMRVLNAKAELRSLVGPWLEPSFGLRLEPAEQRRLTEADYRRFAEALEAANPEIALARAELEQAQRQIEFERNSVLPLVTLRASQERDPTFTLNRVGAMVTVPLLNRREGPIAEAQARAERAKLSLEQRRFEAGAGLEAAWRAYRAAQVRVDALEAGIIDRSRAVVDIAEAAYRFGERGIIEFLDAQRQFRLVRNELISARNELQLARTDLERIAGR